MPKAKAKTKKRDTRRKTKPSDHEKMAFVKTNDVAKAKTYRVSIRHGARYVYRDIDSAIAARIIKQTPAYRIEAAA